MIVQDTTLIWAYFSHYRVIYLKHNYRKSDTAYGKNLSVIHD